MATPDELPVPAKPKPKPKKAKDGLHALPRGGWRFRIYTFGSKDGPRKCFTLPRGTTRAAAVAYLAAEKSKAKALAGKPFLQHFTVRQAWADMETYYRGNGAAENTVLVVAHAGTHVLPLLGDRRLSDLRGSDVETYQRTRIGEKAAAATVNLETRWLRSAIRRAVRARWISEDPLPSGTVKRVPGEAKVPPPLTPAEWARFRDAVEDEERWTLYAARAHALEGDTRLRDKLRAATEAFRFLLLTGSRISEVVGLQWDAVDLEAGSVRIFQAKVHKSKLLPLAPATRAILESRRRAAPAGHVFTFAGKPWERDTLPSAFRSIALASDLRRGPSPHTLRHTASTWLTGEGVPESVVSAVLGHSASTMTGRYIHPSDPQILEALLKLEKVESAVRAPTGRQHDSGISTFPLRAQALSAT